MVAEWSKMLTTVSCPFMVWSTLALGTYQLKFVSWVFHVIFSFVHFISLYTLGGLHAFRKPLPYDMYLFNLRIANHILIKIVPTNTVHNLLGCVVWHWDKHEGPRQFNQHVIVSSVDDLKGYQTISGQWGSKYSSICIC